MSWPAPINYRKIYFPLILTCCVSITAAQGPDSLSLGDVVQKVLQRSHALRQVKFQLSAADARTAQAKAAYYPSVNADASYVNLGPMDNYKLSLGGGSPFSMVPQNGYDVHLDANILLYDFGKRNLAINATKISALTLQHNAAGITTGLAFQAVSLVTTMAMMQQEIDIQNENIGSLARHWDIVKKRLAAGVGTDYDVLKTQAQIAAARALLLDLKNGLQKLRISLSVLIGVTEDSLPAVKISFDAPEFKGRSDSLLAVALKQRPEIIGAQDALAALLIQENLSKKDMAPTLSANLSAGYKNGFIENATKGGLDTLRFNWTAAAALHFPLYDGFKARYREKEIAESRKAADEALADARDKVRADILSALSDVNTAYARLDGSLLQVTVNAEALRLARGKLQAGTITNDDVLNAEQDYAQAKTNYMRDRARYTLSLFALDQATGAPVVK
ncbi:MAG: TolC family protein [Chitinivibrionales bacterium]|nr:TolC family protein [Chitinivibrionales bacterium]